MLTTLSILLLQSAIALDSKDIEPSGQNPITTHNFESIVDLPDPAALPAIKKSPLISSLERVVTKPAEVKEKYNYADIPPPLTSLPLTLEQMEHLKGMGAKVRTSAASDQKPERVEVKDDPVGVKLSGAVKADETKQVEKPVGAEKHVINILKEIVKKPVTLEKIVIPERAVHNEMAIDHVKEIPIPVIQASRSVKKAPIPEKQASVPIKITNPVIATKPIKVAIPEVKPARQGIISLDDFFEEGAPFEPSSASKDDENKSVTIPGVIKTVKADPVKAVIPVKTVYPEKTLTAPHPIITSKPIQGAINIDDFFEDNTVPEAAKKSEAAKKVETTSIDLSSFEHNGKGQGIENGVVGTDDFNGASIATTASSGRRNIADLKHNFVWADDIFDQIEEV